MIKEVLLPVALGLALSATAASAASDRIESAADVRKLEKGIVNQGPEGRQRAGVLSCTIEGGVGLLLGSSKGVACSFDNTVSGETETYTGNINKFGLDIGVSGEQYMRWIVFAQQSTDNTGGLAGTYRGVTAGAGLGIAFGANALIGGSDKSFVLQPVSSQAGTGLNVAVGVASMKLQRGG